MEEAVAAEPADHASSASEIRELPAAPDHLWLLATGPLTGAGSAWRRWRRITGSPALHFFDAIAPTVTLESLDLDVLYRAARYDKGEADYLNAPLDKAGYEAFHAALMAAERAEVKAFDRSPSSSTAASPWRRSPPAGLQSLAFGPLRPVGLHRSAHGPAAPRRGAAAAGEPRGHAVRAGRLPDPPEARRADSASSA